MAQDASGQFGIPRLLGEGRYVIDEMIGEGGMAAVFRAWDTRLKVWRAVKILLPEYHNRKKLRARFEAEAHAMARLEHRHIIRVYDVQAGGALPYIVMELAEGGCIVDWLKRFGPMPPQMAATVTIQICKALTASHAEGLVHRDIKPHNVLVNRQGLCKITDYGIAHVAEDNRTKTGSSMGTLGYMAPEQSRDSKGVDERADVYGVGASLYHLLTLESPNDLFLAEHQPSMLQGVPLPLQEAILVATRWNRDDRCRSTHELGLMLYQARKSLDPDPSDTPAITALCEPLPPAPDPNAPSRQWRRPSGQFGDDSHGDDSYASEARGPAGQDNDQFGAPALGAPALGGMRIQQLGSIEDEAPTTVASSSRSKALGRHTNITGDDDSARNRPTGNRSPASFDDQEPSKGARNTFGILYPEPARTPEEAPRPTSTGGFGRARDLPATGAVAPSPKVAPAPIAAAALSAPATGAKPSYIDESAYEQAYAGSRAAPSAPPVTQPALPPEPTYDGPSADPLKVLVIAVGILLSVVVLSAGSLYFGSTSVNEQQRQAEDARIALDRALEVDLRVVDDLTGAGIPKGNIQAAMFRFHDAQTEYERALAAAAFVAVAQGELDANDPHPDQRGAALRATEKVERLRAASELWQKEFEDWSDASSRFPGSLAVRFGLAPRAPKPPTEAQK